MASLYDFPSGANLGLGAASVMIIIAAVFVVRSVIFGRAKAALGIMALGIGLGASALVVYITNDAFETFTRDLTNKTTWPHTPLWAFILSVAVAAIALVLVVLKGRRRNWLLTSLWGAIFFAATATVSQAGWLYFYQSPWAFANGICWCLTALAVLALVVEMVKYRRKKRLAVLQPHHAA